MLKTVEEYLILRGIEEGKATAAYEMALKMLAEGVYLAFISRITGLTKQDLLQMQNELITT